MSASARLLTTLAGLTASLLCITIGLSTETTNPFRLAIAVGVATTGWAIIDLVVAWRERKVNR